MAQFNPGQKLTATDLNNAFQLAEGPLNPTSALKWTGTNSGRLEASWNTFHNSKSVTPSVLDVDIAVNPLGSPATYKNITINATREVFINVGQWRSTTFSRPYDYLGLFIGIGLFNWMPFIGILGWQRHPAGAIVPGESTAVPNVSLYSFYGNVPANMDDPESWKTSEKLWQSNVARNANIDNWWWTGITLEKTNPDLLFEDNGMGALDIVAYPLFFDVVYNNEESVLNQVTRVAVLVVSTRYDYFTREFLMTDQTRQTVKNLVLTYYGALENMNFIVGATGFINDPSLVTTIASYQYAEHTKNAFYKQQSNFVHFNKDYSAGKLFQFLPNEDTLQANIILYIDPKGVHHDMQWTGNVTNYDGSDPEGEKYETALACGWSSLSNELVLSCVQVPYSNWLYNDVEDITHNILSGLFNDLSIADSDKRLIWVNSVGTVGMRYFDTCPDFSGAKPDSSVSSLILSSLQQLSSGEWSLFEFENLSNLIEMPSLTSQTLKDEFVLREWYDGAAKPAVVRYMPVSAMISAVSSLISANVPDADTPAAGLSSIQTRTLDGGSKVLELYNFHDPAVETVYLSAQSRYDFIVRDNQDHCVKYADLSGIGGDVTLSGTDGSSSTGSKWKFEAFSNSNISVHISPLTILIGCYYI